MPGPLSITCNSSARRWRLARDRDLSARSASAGRSRRARRRACVRPRRLRGVAHDVEHRLDELLAIAVDLGQARVVVAHDRVRPPGYSARIRLRTRSQHLVDVHRADVRRPVRREQAVHQRLQPVGLLDDDLRVLAQVRPVELALEQLRRAAKPAERVLDLVREVADQLAVGAACVRLRSSRSMRSCWSIERSSRTRRARPCSAGVARQLRCSGGRPERSRSIAWSQNAPVLRDRVAELRVELPHLHEEIRETLAGELPRAGLEQVLGRRD